jgi:hypothetical protein
MAAHGQETIFNVPSGDVLDRGKVYAEFDLTYRPEDGAATYTPRVVVGLGHCIEAGLNLNGIGTPAPVATTPTIAVKWKAYDGRRNGWAFLVGDDFFIPVQNRGYVAGNYVYGEFTRTLKTATRLTFGGYHFSRDVVAAAERAGGQFGIEQPVAGRVTLAADWYTGKHALGFVTSGLIFKITSRLTCYATYQLGNVAVSRGNHQFLFEVGWNLN